MNVMKIFGMKLIKLICGLMSGLVSGKKNSTPLYEFSKNKTLYDLLANDSSLATAKQLSLAYRERRLHNCTSVWECATMPMDNIIVLTRKRIFTQMFFPIFEDNTKEMK